MTNYFLNHKIKSMITIPKEIGINLNPGEVAELFCSMDNHEMADFFNQVAAEIEKWEHAFPFQMESLCQTKSLSAEGRAIMKIIGEYSEVMVREPQPSPTEAHGWTRAMIIEKINSMNAICGPDEVLNDLAKNPGPITEADVTATIRNNEPF